MEKEKGKKRRAVGTGPAGPAAAGPILANQPAQKCRMSFSRLFDSCSKRTLAGICHTKIAGDTLCCLKKDPVEP